MSDWWKISRPAGDCTRVDLYDEIGFSDGPGDFLKALAEIKTPKIDLHINSDGGEVTCGLAVFNALKSHPADVTATVDGLAASIASVIALGADKIVMRPQSFMVIHNGHQAVSGDAAKLRDVADKIEAMTSMIAGVYSERTKKPVDEIKTAMDKETWFGAADAKAYGLCDEVSGSASADSMGMSAMRAMMKMDRVPKEIKQQAERMVARLTTETPMSAKAYQKDGKMFIDVDGKPVEFEMEQATNRAQRTEVEPNADDKKAEAEKIRVDAIKGERDYRSAFDTIAKTAGIQGEALAKFEKFYGRSLDDVKFLAEHTIAERAKPVGEGDGGGGDEAQTDDQKVFAKLKTDAATEFKNNRNLRQLFKCGRGIDDSESPEYKASFARFMRVEIKNAADAKGGMRNQIGDDDPVSKVLKNKNVMMQVK